MKTKLLFAFSLLISIMVGAQSTGSVMITEFLPDPSGDESQQEWFEIMNTTSSPIDLDGWTFQDRSSSSRTFVVAGELILPANGYLVFGNTADMSLNGGIAVDYAYNPTDASTFSFNNSNSFDDGADGCNGSVDPDGMTDNELDGLVILDDMMNEIDRLEYDFGYNNANLTGDGNPDGVPNLQAFPGWDDSFTMLDGSSCFMGNASLDDNISIQKVANTGNVLVDWGYSDGTDTAGIFSGTPGAANQNTYSAPSPPSVLPGDIEITEFLPDPTGSEGSNEWFEIHNTTGAAIDIEGWTIRDKSSSSRWHLINSGGPLLVPAGAFVVLANTSDNTNLGVPIFYNYGSISQSSETGSTASGYPSFNNTNSFDDLPLQGDGTGGCGSDADGISDDEVDGVSLIIDGVTIDLMEYDYGYSSSPIGFPDLTTLSGWDNGAPGLEGSSCYMGNADLDDNISIQKRSATGSGRSAADWGFSDGTDTSGIYTGTPGAANQNILSTNDNLSILNFKIYPNPATDFITIEVNNIQISSVNVYDILGKNVISKNSLDNNTLSISNLKKGVYFLKIEAEGITSTKKIIKE